MMDFIRRWGPIITVIAAVIGVLLSITQTRIMLADKAKKDGDCGCTDELGPLM